MSSHVQTFDRVSGRRFSDSEHAVELEGSLHQARSQRLRIQCLCTAAGLGYAAQVPARGGVDGSDSRGDGVGLHSRLDARSPRHQRDDVSE